MIAATRSNLFFGTGLLNNLQELRIIDMSEIDGSQNCRFVMRYTAGVAVGIGSDVVFYS